jgi:quercetin dioxygenase-like cupin family protein
MPTPELILGNLFIRPNVGFTKGQIMGGHKHNFDHVTFLTRGSWRIRILNDDQTVRQEVTKVAFSFVLIKAGAIHELEALEDHSDFYCVYAHRDPQGQVTQEYTGWDDAHR